MTDAAAALDRSASGRPPGQVRRRRVFYVSGFDPRGPVGYYALFRRELWKFHKSSGVATKISKLALDEGGLEARWTVTCDGGSWRTETAVTFLRWDDIIGAVYHRPNWRRLGMVWRSGVISMTNGQLAAVGRESGRFLAVWAAVAVLFIGFSLLAAAIGVGVGAVLAPAAAALGLPGWSAALPAAALAYALFCVAARTTRGAPFYVSHLVDDMNFNWGYLRGRFAHVDARIAAFAEIIGTAVAASDDDEVLVVAHSSGPLLAAEALARALDADPALGRRGPALGFVTLGSAVVWCGLDPRGGRLRAAIARLVAEPDVMWVDFQAVWDWLAFWRHDPATACGVPREPASSPNPLTRKVFITEVMAPQTIAATKLNFFRRHFQFLMASEGPAAYDYFAMTCGPDSLRTLMARDPRAPMTLRAAAPARK